MRICLDTSAYSNAFRGKPEMVDVLSRSEWVGLPSIVIGELEVGFRLGSQRLRNIEKLDDFLGDRRVEILSTNREIAEIYADMFVDQLRRGNPLPTNDIWIAAISAGYGSTLVTYDAHFRDISRLAKVVL
ncbi:MAG: type II toxin-antitoxin system VapC family toxin [Gammaproteobacteria bacterium]|nr:type II toxin-antitoxin system VapC family toxin [Gammaproteobacteria bacterium]